MPTQTNNDPPNTHVAALAAIKAATIGESAQYLQTPFFRDDRRHITLIDNGAAQQFNNDYGAAELVRRALPGAAPMTTTKTNKRTDEPKLPLTIDAQNAMGQAYSKDDPAAGRAAQIRLNAAYVAEAALKDVTWLRDKLNRTIERLATAATVKDAYMSLVDLRTSLWADIQAELTQLQTYDGILPLVK